MKITNNISCQLLNQPLRTAVLLLLSLLTLGIATPSQAVIEIHDTQVTFQWAAATGPVAYYTVYVSRDGGTPGPESLTSSSAARQATFGGTPGEVLVLFVAAVDSNGNLGPFSPASEAILFLAGSPSSLGSGVYATSMTAGLGTPLNEPVFVTAPQGDGRLFILERAGLIQVLETGVLRSTPFLDIRSQVDTNADGGLLGMAFDPDYADNGIFYVYYTDRSGDSVLSRFSLDVDPNWVNPTSEEILLTVTQPYSDRNGGTIAFSPIDGYLYLGLGDGGSSYDPNEAAQYGGTLLGKMLRLDVSGGVGSGYSIPGSNPYVSSSSTLDEIWARGLRNPRRFSFDSANGDLWIGDEGQDTIEEIDYVAAGTAGGMNFGWDIMEGNNCNPIDPASSPSCNHVSLTAPLLDYEHLSVHCAVVGGSVYRGPTQDLDGQYVFGDFCSGQLWRLDTGSQSLQDLGAELSLNPVNLEAIGEGGFGDLYTVQSTGEITRIGSPSLECADGIDNDGDGLIDVANDPGCTSATDSSERDSDLPCDDGFDNDRSGAIDFPADSGCSSPTDTTEYTQGNLSPSESDDDNAKSGGGSGGACGFGFEIAFFLPPMLAWRNRRRERKRSGANTQSR
jgi:hypothetical protein